MIVTLRLCYLAPLLTNLLQFSMALKIFLSLAVCVFLGNLPNALSDPVGEHKVTLSIYSGVPDPVWTVDSRHESFAKMKGHLQSARFAGRSYRHEHMPSNLGYRGFLVHAPDAKEPELIVGQETKELQKLLLQTMPKGLISDALLQKILKGIESILMHRHPKDALHQHLLQATTSPEPIQHYAPVLNLDRWNSDPLIQGNNNCYNYANDKITNSFAQPGTGSGHPYQEITPEEMLRASEYDGLVQLNVSASDPPPEAPEQPNCVVALVVAEDVDFHWYRLDDNGLWSHKPGSSRARNHDGNGNLISDPRKAANSPFGPDYKFVSFMEIFTNIIDGPLGPH